MKDKSKKSTYSTTFGVDPKNAKRGLQTQVYAFWVAGCKFFTGNKKALKSLSFRGLKLEAWVGIEPTHKA